MLLRLDVAQGFNATSYSDQIALTQNFSTATIREVSVTMSLSAHKRRANSTGVYKTEGMLWNGLFSHPLGYKLWARGVPWYTYVNRDTVHREIPHFSACLVQ